MVRNSSYLPRVPSLLSSGPDRSIIAQSCALSSFNLLGRHDAGKLISLFALRRDVSAVSDRT